MRHSLRFRALLLVFLFNSAVFAALGVVLVRSQAEGFRRTEETWTEDLVATIQNTIAPEGLKVASILRWPSWRFIADAVLVDQHVALAPGGGVSASGIQLNPVGVAGRRHDFDRDAALRALREAMNGGEPVPVMGGRAVPIRVDGGVWGGLWYRSKQTGAVDYGEVLVSVLPWFALSTLLLTGATFFAMRLLVLDPVFQLADGARRLRGGDFGVSLRVPKRKDELAELVRSFNVMASTVASFNQRLSDEVRMATEKARAAEAAAMRERRLAAMGELAAGIAHEINNPLGGLQNAVEDLKRPDLSPERSAQYLDLLARGLERIGETVSRLRRFTPREEAAFEPVDLEAVLQDARELVQHRARRLGVELAVERAGSAFVVRGVRNDIGQAVLNLLVNSLDALEEGGTRETHPRITAALAAGADGVRLTVRDNGPGVEPHVLERARDLFYTTKEVGRGTGLGLSLVHSAMQRHGGRLHLASEAGRSFTAELEFPAAGASAQGRVPEEPA